LKKDPHEFDSPSRIKLVRIFSLIGWT